jgi:hypothetical protein
LVRGKTVAVVGNASSLIDSGESKAASIDSHDVVIRMNAGVPGVLREDRIGRKTTVWATAKWFGIEPRPELLVFMKLTRLGDAHWAKIRHERRPYPKIRWTQELEDEVREYVGADPGTGIRILHFLKHHCQPAKVHVYGMDCWDTLSSWSCKPNTPNHNPIKEKAALLRLLSE